MKRWCMQEAYKYKSLIYNLIFSCILINDGWKFRCINFRFGWGWAFILISGFVHFYTWSNHILLSYNFFFRISNWKVLKEHHSSLGWNLMLYMKIVLQSMKSKHVFDLKLGSNPIIANSKRLSWGDMLRISHWKK